MQRLRELSDRYYPRVVRRLERLGVPRSLPPLLILGVVAAVTAVVLAVVVSVTSRTAPAQPPLAIAPTIVGKQGSAVVNADRAQVQAIAMVTRNRWAAGWADCISGPTCRYTAVIDRDGSTASAPEWPVPYATLRSGSEAFAVAPPPEGTLDGDATVLFRLTYDGPVTSRLRYRLPTRTFERGEILTDQIVPGRIVVVNPADWTVRMLDTRGTRSPSCDRTGRCWMLAGIARTDIIWTDDGGKTWGAEPLDRKNQLGRLAVSPDGRTVVTTSVAVGSVTETVTTMRISSDRGEHWTTVEQVPSRLDTAPIAFNDGTALMLGGRSGDPKPRLYRITGGTARLEPGFPGDLSDLSGDAGLLYGPEVPKRRTTEVALSTDQGKSWTKFSPR